MLKISKTIVEQVTIEGPNEQRDAAYTYIRRGGYRIIESGPKPLSKRDYADSAFRIVAERDECLGERQWVN